LAPSSCHLFCPGNKISLTGVGFRTSVHSTRVFIKPTRWRGRQRKSSTPPRSPAPHRLPHIAMAGGVVASQGSHEPFNLRHHRWALIYCGFFVMGAVLYGYDGTYFTGIVAMPGFLQRFGDTVINGQPGLKSGTLSLLASIVQVGELVGSLLATFVGSAYGRKGGLLVACALVSVGCVIQIAATGSIAQLTVGRLVLGQCLCSGCLIRADVLHFCRHGYRTNIQRCSSVSVRGFSGGRTWHCCRFVAAPPCYWTG
jgi:hypothetical protein